MELQSLARTLEASLDPTQNKQAETVLLQEQKKPGFSLLLLRIVASDTYGSTARLASALYFKNFIRRNWTDENGNYRLPQQEVVSIKQELIGLMINVPANIQYQLGDAVGVIADSDFWRRWDTLVDDLVSRLTPDNARINNGVLQVAHSIFKRWRPLYRSDELFTEVNHVLGKFGDPFVQLLGNTDQIIERNRDDRLALSQYFSTMNLLMKLLYDLSVQDLPPIFEDNMQSLTSLLHKYLIYDNPLLHADDDSESGPLEFVKSGIFEVLVLYAQKYEDAFGPFVEQFVGSSWNLLTTTGLEPKNDILVSKALQFLTSVTRLSQHAQAFNNEDTMSQVIERVVLPNLSLRDSDMEMFEDEPIEFIRRDLEGSDSDTRRRAATDFLQQLLAQFQKLVTDIVLRYINHYLSEYSRNPSANWKSKDTAVYLFSSIAAKGAVTTSQGVKSVNELVNIIDFFQANVAADLLSDSDVEPILKVDAIKYLYMFRSQITREQWRDAFPLVVKHLGSPEYVVYTYAAIALERVLALTDRSKQSVIEPADVTPLSAQLLEHLFQLIERNPEPPKLQENEFLMRCVMRVLIVIRDGVVPITDIVLANFTKITQIISSNPANPRFYYYHFEALGAFIRFAAPLQPEKLENGLYPVFLNILENDVQEFIPYVFQLFAALLEANLSGSLTAYYTSLAQPILSPQLWSSRGNIPALVRLVSSLLTRGASQIAENKQLEPILGIFQNLITNKVNEIYGFELLESIMANFAPSIIEPYFVAILQLLFTRLQNSKTEAFSARFVRFYHFISSRIDSGLGADWFINHANQVQEGLYVQLYLTIILPDTQKLARPLDRKIAVISLCKTLTDSVSFADKYKKGWGYTCETLLKLLENPPTIASTDDTIADQDVDDMSFGVGFTQLQTIKRPARDFWPEVMDVKSWVGQELQSTNAKQGGKIKSFAEERLVQSPQALQVLSTYMSR
ncbi:MAG: hypothetical protein L6R38_003143 [Xanthoria sp. 2 TBL-2021]|nr:MAG: hypothetical protein L6R38_003143 [Xanthoria sp. 2 TBL-2021]